MKSKSFKLILFSALVLLTMIVISCSKDLTNENQTDATVTSSNDALTLKGDMVMPTQVAYKKKSGSKFFEVMSKDWK